MQKGRVCARKDDGGYPNDSPVGPRVLYVFTTPQPCLVFDACEYSSMGTIGARNA